MNEKDLTPSEESIKEITDLETGDHLCCIYEDDEEHREVLTPFIKQGLEANQKVIYIVDANTADVILNYLREENYSPKPYLDSGQLLILTQDQSYVKGGEFDPDSMIELLKEETEKALEEGYEALRVTGEMTWALRGHPGSERLMEYENKLNHFFPDHPALGLCQYDRREFDPEVLLGVLRTHPIAVIGEEVYDNFHYIEPGELLGDEPGKAELESWEEGLARSKEKKLRLEHSNSLLRSVRNVNQLLVQEKEKESLIEGICDALTETRGLNAVWIALFDESGGLNTVAQAGLDQDFRPMLRKLESGDFPERVRRTLDESGVLVTKNPPSTCSDCPLSESYAGMGSLASRLEYGGRIYGLIAASVEKNYIDDREEKSLFEEVAGDIAFGMHNIETENELKKSKERYQKYFEKTGDAIFILKMGGEHHGRILDANSSAEKQTGYSRDELLGMNMIDDLSAEKPNPDPEEIDRRLERGETVNFTEKKRSKDGSEYWTEVVVTPLEHEGKQANLSINRDVTERKRALEKLRKKEKEQSVLFSNLPGMAYRCENDRDWTMHFVSEGVKELTGYAPEDLIDSSTIPYAELIVEEDRDKVWNQVQRALDAGAQYEVEYRIERRSGEERYVWEQGRGVYDEDGELQNLQGFITDITEERRSQRKLRQSFVELAETTSRVLGVRDPYTEEHEQRVAQLAREVGERMGLDEDRLLGLYIGGILHDIGKIAIPETILTKPGELKEVEWNMIKSHPEVGYNQILEDTHFPWPVAEMTLHHHERLDGSGYPDGLEGDELMTEVRILGPVDVAEAMSTRRPYREARTKERTEEVLREGKGEKFDPEVVEILLDMIEEGEIEFGGE